MSDAMASVSVAERRGIAWRISLHMAAIFVVPGVHLPFWAVWLESRGLNAPQISAVISAGIWIRLIAGPTAAHLVDRSGARRQAIILLSWASLIIFSLFWWTHGFWPIFLLSIAFAALWSPITPFSENVAVLSATRYGLQYGRLRLWGSLSFLLTAYTAGLWLKGRDGDWIYALLMAGLLVLALGSLLLPDLRLPLNRPKLAGAPALRLLRNRFFLAFLGANACLQSSHAMLYTFGTLQWRNVGLSDARIGLLWAEGVLAEVILFAAGQRVAVKVGGVGLMLLASVGGMVRWGLTSLTDSFSLLILLNLLHAATFGCAHLGAMRLLSEGIDPQASATAQTLYTAANASVLASVTLLIGPLFPQVDGLTYLVMLPLSLVGGIFALLLWRQRAAVRFTMD